MMLQEKGPQGAGPFLLGGGTPKQTAAPSIGACRVFLYRPATQGERRTDPIGSTVAMRGMIQVTTMFSMANQFPNLIAWFTKN